MFIVDVIKKEDAEGELKLLYKVIERSLGFVPKHFELFATINIEAMKEFVSYNQKILMHEKMDKDLLPYLRLEIAKRECREYCIAFNSEMIAKTQSKYDISQEILLQKVLKAIYKSKNFGSKDLKELDKAGFNAKDFFDLLSYATDFIAKSKLIEVYTK